MSAVDESRPLPPLLPRSRRARKLLRWLIVAFVLAVAYDYYFGPDDDPERLMPPPKVAPGRLSESPEFAVYQVYNSIADGGIQICFYFDTADAAAFAHSFQASSCETVVKRFQGKVDRDPKDFHRWSLPSRNWVAISSCSASLRAGTINLGRFLVTEPIPGEWIISGHGPEPFPCPVE